MHEVELRALLEESIAERRSTVGLQRPRWRPSSPLRDPPGNSATRAPWRRGIVEKKRGWCSLVEGRAEGRCAGLGDWPYARAAVGHHVPRDPSDATKWPSRRAVEVHDAGHAHANAWRRSELRWQDLNKGCG
jgi:hypothetical protein